MSTFTYTRLLVPAQYEKEEATMTVAFDDIGDAAAAREVAVREVRTALRLAAEKPVEPARPTETSAALPGSSSGMPTGLPGTAPSAATPTEASPSPLPGAGSSTLPGPSDTISGTSTTGPTSVNPPTGGSWEWTKPNVRAFCQEAVDRLEKTGGIEAATSKVLDVIGQFAPKTPPLASEIEPDKRAGFIAAIDALR